MHILIFGGYGNFGGILSRLLSTTADIHLTLLVLFYGLNVPTEV